MWSARCVYAGVEMGMNRCPHGKPKLKCVECNPCPHGKLKNSCVECKGCPQGKLKRNCAECKRDSSKRYDCESYHR